MKLAELSPTRLAWLRTCRYESFIEKHEGPWDWDSYLLDDPEEHADFLTIDGHDVLLPVSATHHPNITALRTIVSADGRTLTIFLRDLTLGVRYPTSYRMNNAWGWAGHLAICERAPEAAWYVATLYHEIYLADEDTPVRLEPWTGD
ncbi:MAG TPA: hypothetical protein VFE42_29840 [Chloroflexota bacterium]|nr:hypothetical protein [Chloroflexota bacterium]